MGVVVNPLMKCYYKQTDTAHQLLLNRICHFMFSSYYSAFPKRNSSPWINVISRGIPASLILSRSA